MSTELETKEQLQERYLAIVSSGRTSAFACQQLGIDPRRPAKWASRDSTFAERRHLARVAAAGALEQELLTAPKEYEPGRARVITENIRWLLTKWVPATYGEKLDLNVNAPPDIKAAIAAGRARRSRLPGRDQEFIEGAQIVDTTSSVADGATDSGSDAHEESARQALAVDSEEQTDPLKDPQFLALL